MEATSRVIKSHQDYLVRRRAHALHTGVHCRTAFRDYQWRNAKAYRVNNSKPNPFKSPGFDRLAQCMKALPERPFSISSTQKEKVIANFRIEQPRNVSRNMYPAEHQTPRRIRRVSSTFEAKPRCHPVASSSRLKSRLPSERSEVGKIRVGVITI